MARGGKKGREGAASPVAHESAPEVTAGATAGPEIPRWLPPVLYGVVTLFLFRSFVFSDAMLVGQDTLSLGYMARDFYANALKQGVLPLWNPIILGGTPFLESLAGGDSLYPPSVLLLLVMSWSLFHRSGATTTGTSWCALQSRCATGTGYRQWIRHQRRCVDPL